MNDPECLFCKILAGEIPSYKVFESEFTLAFLDIAPVSEGHTVVIPKNHYYNLLDIPENEILPFFNDLKTVANLIKTKLGCEGFNIVQNNFPAAGQVIPHFHFHIWPRISSDKLSHFQRNPEIANKEEIESVFKKFTNDY
ncbi:hypothetical protein NEF87_002738 [Candidatus Lokiarchaeum ossiferum]|uniref:HIT domain-containing protein n=1 Tax=Candidatus Lokiarchaeum ossiferum TaxID=2951803 RepID=A0ABY6HSG7_9ARCH|nr:hypothetical protein NEF87_002738 [Candidatus Lokiarchaeum sp. B-35]